MKNKQLDYYVECLEHYDKLMLLHPNNIEQVINGIIASSIIEPVNSYQINKEEAITLLLIHNKVSEEEIRAMTIEEKLSYTYLFGK